MQHGDLVWRICLLKAPDIVQLGQAVHGRPGGPSVDRYRLPDLWCLHFYQYEAVLELNGRSHRIYPGTASVVPPDTAMVYHYNGLSEHSFCHFRLAQSNGDDQVDVPAVQRLGRRSSEMYLRFADAALQAFPSTARRQALVWDLLWSLSEVEEPSEGPRHPAFTKATRIIERDLAQGLTVSDIARQAGVSYGYLSRVFRAETGLDVVGYIRQRRVQRAEHLLRSSTLPIKSIAASIGISDLAHFNRLIHRTHGCSPSELRKILPDRRC
jgi:AraC-like DNA-binding protein